MLLEFDEGVETELSDLLETELCVDNELSDSDDNDSDDNDDEDDSGTTD
ncbi:hypothetical protein CCP1ISM_20047 [Azospirillaceae bacterium]